MTAVIHQAYFLPWLGYFSKLSWSSSFILLDDVQFVRDGFHARTRLIGTHGDVRWLSVPVSARFGISCKDVLVRNGKFLETMVQTIRQAYGGAEHYENEMPWIEEMLRHSIVSGRQLVNIDLELIRQIVFRLKLNPPKIFFSSAFVTSSERTQRIIQLCKNAGASRLLIGGGAGKDVHDWDRIRAAGIDVVIQDFHSNHPIYSQRHRRHSFEKGLSIIDALLNAGSPATRDFLLDTRHCPKPFENSL